jgi:hypothetical protein
MVQTKQNMPVSTANIKHSRLYSSIKLHPEQVQVAQIWEQNPLFEGFSKDR